MFFKRKRKAHEEDDHCMALMQWVDIQRGAYPELNLLFHIPNGGKRGIREAARFKAMGVKSGVPDYFLPVARNRIHGMFIEMKSAKGKLSENQQHWRVALTDQNYRFVVCYSWTEASEALLNYLKGY